MPTPAEGVFWYDHIRTLRSDPAKRLKVALKQLPLPAAFRESMIACRALIRQRRNENKPYGTLLHGLYILQCQETFLLSTPYLEELRMPGFNVAASIPPKVLHSIPMPYKNIGYQHISANKTDIKWFVEAWGEPEGHVNPQKYHSQLWTEAVDRYRRKIRC